ncbi:serine/threonine-protein kinase PAK 6 [Elysia marginata]|uniref:Serine/threonine-protein kinase PAK 6 n=1 Tax=Elysia marginata TaxID=1093978 RepID=A0AAV4HR51_9GAST|nr:serine/threonine-protein kinase PAK 6 [Elysia marginata]
MNKSDDDANCQHLARPYCNLLSDSDRGTVTDEYINAQSPITRMKCYPQPESNTDLLLCAGHFNVLQIYKDGVILSEFETSGWVISIDSVDVDEDGTDEVLISCMDNTVAALKMNYFEVNSS